MKIFDKETFLKDCLSQGMRYDELIEDLNTWVKVCDGKEVELRRGFKTIYNVVGTPYSVVDTWVKEVD